MFPKFLAHFVIILLFIITPLSIGILQQLQQHLPGGVLTKLTRKHLCQRLSFNKVAGLRSATLLKESLRHRCFLDNFAKISRTPFLQNNCGDCLQQLLQITGKHRQRGTFRRIELIHFSPIFHSCPGKPELVTGAVL